ncbi:MAG TPA: BamA/TamA family outer membrane protein [Chroococcidiopsis sp.]
MNGLHHLSIVRYALFVALGAASTNLLLANASWGQTAPSTPVPPSEEVAATADQEQAALSVASSVDEVAIAQPSETAAPAAAVPATAVPAAAEETEPAASFSTDTDLTVSPTAPSTTASQTLPTDVTPATQASTVEASAVEASTANTAEPEVIDANVSLHAVDLLNPSAPSPSPTFGASAAPFEQAQASPDAERRNGLTFSFSSGLPDPTALYGTLRRRNVRFPIKSTGIAASASVQYGLGDLGELNLVVEGGEHILAFDLGLNLASGDPRQGLAFNIFNQRSFSPAYRGGDRDVDLPNGDTPWLHRLGAGIEYALPLSDDIASAFGITYQRVSVRDDMFTDDVQPVDEDGNALTVDSDGIDDLLTFNFSAARDTRDERRFPTTGNLIRAGIDQGFTLGSEDVSFTRLSASYTQYIPFNLFGFDDGPRTLIFNVQGGGIFGDVPSYEGFNVGGTNSVRGYQGGGIGTGTAAFQATVEYRFPIFSLNAFSRDIPIRGVLFVDYGTTFGTNDEVIGEPAEARDKPGDGLGFGAGLHAQTPFGLGRVEFALTDDGDSEVILTIGDRF